MPSRSYDLSLFSSTSCTSYLGGLWTLFLSFWVQHNHACLFTHNVINCTNTFMYVLIGLVGIALFILSFQIIFVQSKMHIEIKKNKGEIHWPP